jgi:hypothetical protein
MNIIIPDNNNLEREYIINIMFREFLGLSYNIIYNNQNYWQLNLNNGNKIFFEDYFFNKNKKILAYLNYENIPEIIEFQKKRYNTFMPQNDLPIIYGKNKPVKIEDYNEFKTIYCTIDIFASSFFMLTRWEEYVNKTRDEHVRFPATASLAYRSGFLNRSVVNEYVEMLWNMIKELAPGLHRKKRKTQVLVSCDVDQPFDSTVDNLKNLVRVCGGDVIKRHSCLEAIKRVRRFIFNKTGNYKYDENYTFKWYMDTCEKNNLQVAFYFIPDNSEPGNGSYSLKEKRIVNLLKIINQRGHEIGVHGSYQSYRDKEKTVKHKAMFENALKNAGINEPIKGNRQHYLRWDSAVTPAILDEAGFEYDTSGSYADSAGFRYGVCYEFSMWDILNQKKLTIKQRPLIVMECSVIDDRYMGIGYGEQAFVYIKKLKDECRKYNGDFVILWHNSRLRNDEEKRFYKQVLDC